LYSSAYTTPCCFIVFKTTKFPPLPHNSPLSQTPPTQSLLFVIPNLPPPTIPAGKGNTTWPERETSPTKIHRHHPRLFRAGRILEISLYVVPKPHQQTERGRGRDGGTPRVTDKRVSRRDEHGHQRGRDKPFSAFEFRVHFS